MSKDLEKMLANLVEKIERRFFGKYRGTVVDNEDPEQLGRLRMNVPSVLGADVVTGWALPCVPYGGDANQGSLFIPEIGAGVWVEFEEGDLEYPVWVGTYWSKPGGESELPKPNDADGVEEGSVQDPVTRKIIKTKAGHTLQFEDAADEEMIVLYEGKHAHVVTLDADGIKLVDGERGHQLVFSDDGIVMEDGQNGNKVTMESSGTTIEDSNGNKIVMSASGINVGSDSAAEPFVLGQQFMLEVTNFIVSLSTHTHVGNMGAPTSPPTAPMQLNVPLSAKHKLDQ